MFNRKYKFNLTPNRNQKQYPYWNYHYGNHWNHHYNNHWNYHYNNDWNYHYNNHWNHCNHCPYNNDYYGYNSDSSWN